LASDKAFCCDRSPAATFRFALQAAVPAAAAAATARSSSLLLLLLPKSMVLPFTCRSRATLDYLARDTGVIPVTMQMNYVLSCIRM
jgi:hypothetical protein